MSQKQRRKTVNQRISFTPAEHKLLEQLQALMCGRMQLSRVTKAEAIRHAIRLTLDKYTEITPAQST